MPFPSHPGASQCHRHGKPLSTQASSIGKHVQCSGHTPRLQEVTGTRDGKLNSQLGGFPACVHVFEQAGGNKTPAQQLSQLQRILNSFNRAVKCSGVALLLLSWYTKPRWRLMAEQDPVLSLILLSSPGSAAPAEPTLPLSGDSRSLEGRTPTAQGMFQPLLPALPSELRSEQLTRQQG